MQNNLIDLTLTKVEKLVKINGVSFEEQFIAKLIAEHLAKQQSNRLPTITDAFNIYIKESTSAHNWRFVATATRHFEWFRGLFGDLTLDELRHWHITQYRDYQLARGLNPSSVRKHNNTLNAMLNVAFKHLDIDRLSPFRALKIRGEGEIKRHMPTVTEELIHAVKEKLLKLNVPHSYVSLIQLNTGFRISEPVFAKLEHCVLEHDIPHLWVKKTELCDRKTKSSIRAVPLYGVSLDAAKKLYSIAKKNNSEWFVYNYARHNGNTSCSAIVNKSLREFGFRSHMFRHAIIDRMKACNDIPTRLAESITGHTSGKSHFNTYGTVGYTLEQKLEVIKKSFNIKISNKYMQGADMRIFEVTNPEEQLGLLKLIIDSTWSAIQKQADEQRSIDAAKKLQSKLKAGRTVTPNLRPKQTAPVKSQIDVQDDDLKNVEDEKDEANIDLGGEETEAGINYNSNANSTKPLTPSHSEK